MSRAAVSKSRAEKGKPPASQTPIVSHEIVPGKFTDHDWNLMLERDSVDDFIEDIVEDFIGTSINKCYELYITKQLNPYTITQAKDAILGIIEWHFLARDEGELHQGAEMGWVQDEEPDPAVTDCWAQGSVPKTFIPVPIEEVIMEEEEDLQAVEEVEEERNKKEEVVVQEEPELEDRVSEATEDQDEVERIKRIEEEEQKAKEEAKKKRKIKFKPYRGRLKSSGINSESLEQSELTLMAAELSSMLPPPEHLTSSGLINMPASCHSILKVQAGRPPGSKDVVYDEMGNVIAVVKLNPDRLPSHRVTVRYQVVDPAVEAARARLEAMRTGKYSTPQRGFKKKSSLKKDQTDQIKSSTEMDLVKQKPVKTPLPPPLIETMEVAPGVLVREGGRVKQGPARYIRRMDMLTQSQTALRPVPTKMLTPRLDVSDILDRHTPILRPMNDSLPLPPIVPQPPPRQQIST
ncbi:hypothetical protein ACJMK2_035461 [Sinanodonta woodiana]|uniref:Uncharacterized protein n=1 Tax=Sinanodonta woodiana TaxID=1069815 RepID=A0ABD3WV23_SINWO